MTELTISRTCAIIDRCEQFTSGRVGARVKFSFSSEWAGLSKTAVFTNGDTTIDVLNVADEITIPHEVLAISGKKLKVGVYGYTVGDNGNIEIAIPTVYADLGKVVKGADPSGDESTEPSLPVWAQMQSDVSDLDTRVTGLEEHGGGGGSAVELDTTLTQSGKAADAKAVGDALAGKQDTISDLETIRSGASKGATALQSVPNTYRTAEAQDVIDSGKQDKLIAGDNITIAADGKTISAIGGGGDAVVTAEKAFAASVLELNHVADNQYVAQHDSMLFEATEDTTLSVGSDNMISNAPVSTSVNSALAPTIVVTEVVDGYKYELNPDYTGSDHFQNYRVYFSANIQNGKTYTLAFKADGDCYLYLSADTAGTGTLIGDKRIPTVDGKKVLTFTATADYGYARIVPNNLPRTLTEITLCEGDVALEYGGGAETYSLSAGEKMWLSGVKGLNCVGVGNFYESPLAVTSFNGVAPSTGVVKSCATKKTWVNMGDSIWTFGASTGGIGTITDYMLTLCGGTWHNIATGGTTMASRPGSYAGTYDALDFWKIADAIVAGNYTDAKAAAAELTSNFANIDNVNWSAVDYVTVAYGTNDLAFGAAIDNASNLFDTATICGALRYGIKAINSAYPNIRFKVLGVVYRSADAVTPANIIECNEALRSAAAYVGAEFVDGYGINAGNSGTFLYDGTHPNANGKARIAETLARSIHEVWYE